MVGDKNLVMDLLGRLHTTVEERERAITQLRSLDPVTTKEQLRALLTETNPDLVCDAADVMMMIDSKQGVEFILPLSNHPSGTVRWCFCTLLHDYVTAYDSSDKRIAKLLLELLLRDPEDNVRLVSAKALGRIADPSSLSALQHAADNDKGADWEGRTVADAARRAIERITSPPKRLWS